MEAEAAISVVAAVDTSPAAAPAAFRAARRREASRAVDMPVVAPIVAEAPTAEAHTEAGVMPVAVHIGVADTTVAADIIAEADITAAVVITAAACIWALASAPLMLMVPRTATDMPLLQLLAVTMTSGVTGCRPRVLSRPQVPRIPARVINSHLLMGAVGLTAPTRSEIM